LIVKNDDIALRLAPVVKFTPKKSDIVILRITKVGVIESAESCDGQVHPLISTDIREHFHPYVIPIYTSIIGHVCDTGEHVQYIHTIITGGFPLPGLFISRFQPFSDSAVSVFVEPYIPGLTLWGGGGAK